MALARAVVAAPWPARMLAGDGVAQRGGADPGGLGADRRGGGRAEQAQRLVGGDSGGGHLVRPGGGGGGDGLTGGQGLLFLQVHQFGRPPQAVQFRDVAGRVGDGVHQAGDDSDGLRYFHPDGAAGPRHIPSWPASPPSSRTRTDGPGGAAASSG